MPEVNNDGRQVGFTEQAVTVPANGGGAVQVDVPPTATVMLLEWDPARNGDIIDVSILAGEPLASVNAQLWTTAGGQFLRVVPVRGMFGVAGLQTIAGRVDLENTTVAAPATVMRVRWL